ncbi:hypothetical protein BST61_g10305 [Cercospora zeina]
MQKSQATGRDTLLPASRRAWQPDERRVLLLLFALWTMTDDQKRAIFIGLFPARHLYNVQKIRDQHNQRWSGGRKERDWRQLDRPNEYNRAAYTPQEYTDFANAVAEIEREAANLNIPLALRVAPTHEYLRFVPAGTAGVPAGFVAPQQAQAPAPQVPAQPIVPATLPAPAAPVAGPSNASVILPPQAPLFAAPLVQGPAAAPTVHPTQGTAAQPTQEDAMMLEDDSQPELPDWNDGFGASATDNDIEAMIAEHASNLTGPYDQEQDDVSSPGAEAEAFGPATMDPPQPAYALSLRALEPRGPVNINPDHRRFNDLHGLRMIHHKDVTFCPLGAHTIDEQTHLPVHPDSQLYRLGGPMHKVSTHINPETGEIRGKETILVCNTTWCGVCRATAWAEPVEDAMTLLAEDSCMSESDITLQGLLLRTRGRPQVHRGDIGVGRFGTGFIPRIGQNVTPYSAAVSRRTWVDGQIMVDAPGGTKLARVMICGDDCEHC